MYRALKVTQRASHTSGDPGESRSFTYFLLRVSRAEGASEIGRKPSGSTPREFPWQLDETKRSAALTAPASRPSMNRGLGFFSSFSAAKNQTKRFTITEEENSPYLELVVK